MKKGLVALLSTLVIIIVVTMTGCLALDHNRVTHFLPPDKVIDLKKAFSDSMPRILPGWNLAVVYEATWVKSVGLNSDDYNNVMIRAYLPEGSVTLVPANGWQEEQFAKTYEPGDVIAFRLIEETITGGNINRVFQNTIRVNIQDIYMVVKGGALK